MRLRPAAPVLLASIVCSLHAFIREYRSVDASLIAESARRAGKKLLVLTVALLLVTTVGFSNTAYLDSGCSRLAPL